MGGSAIDCSGVHLQQMQEVNMSNYQVQSQLLSYRHCARLLLLQGFTYLNSTEIAHHLLIKKEDRGDL